MERFANTLVSSLPGLIVRGAGVCYVGFGRRPSKHTVKRVLEEEPTPLRMVRRFDGYHEMSEPRERRLAVVRLHAEGWTATSIASYLRTSRQTVYSVLKRWVDEGEAGLDDRPGGRPKGVRKVTLGAIATVRELQRNLELGEFRVHAALKQLGLHLSPRTCGRILALNRRLYGLEKPRAGRGARKEMPFSSRKRHEFWTADVRYLDAVDKHRLDGRAYVVSVLENHSRAVLASSVTRTQDLAAFLSVLERAVERYGSPEALVTDGGNPFYANAVTGWRPVLASATYGRRPFRRDYDGGMIGRAYDGSWCRRVSTPSAVFALAFVWLGWIASHTVAYGLVGLLPDGYHHGKEHVHGYTGLLKPAAGLVLVVAFNGEVCFLPFKALAIVGSTGCRPAGPGGIGSAASDLPEP